MPEHEVYASTGSPIRGRLLSAVAARSRRRRHDRFFAQLGLPDDARILDVGCGALGLRALEPMRDITGVDLGPRPDYPGPFVQADATDRLPFADGEFDFVYSSSVIEHVAPPKRAAFAREIRRVGDGFLVQTPAWSFPIEPHALLPFAHWLPVGARRRYWRLGVQGTWEDVQLLRRADMHQLFEVPIRAERVGPVAKSWLAIAAPGRDS